MGQAPSRWASVLGPFAAMMLSLHRIGWTLASPLVYQASGGQQYPLTCFSPAFAQSKMQQAWHRQL